MLGQGKKRNPAVDKGGDDNDTPMVPKKLPPLRTFVIRTQGYNEVGEPAILERVIDAHGLGIDDARMISFVVFFYTDAGRTQVAQAMKLVLNSNAWDEVEEINPLFPVLETH